MKTRLTVPIILMAFLLLAGCGPGPGETPAAITPTQNLPTQTPAPSTPTATIQTLAGWLDEFSAYAAEAGTSGEFAGAVLFARGEEILWESAYGLADRDTSRYPNSDSNPIEGTLTCQ